MNATKFTEVVDNQLSRCRSVLLQKGNLYSEGDDRLGNFKKAANLQGTTPTTALLGIYSKHIVCLSDLIPSSAVAIEQWDKTITDSINYLLLLRALIEEGRE